MAITSNYTPTPAPIQQTLASAYLDFTGGSSTDWARQYVPDLMEKEAEVFGNRTISGFLSQVGAEEAMQSDQVVWSEQGRLHLCYKGRMKSATTTASDIGSVSAGTCFIAGSVSGGAFGAGVGVTITGDGNAVFSGITTVTYFDATSTLVEAFSSTTTAWNSSGDLNISDGNVQFCSTVLGGTTNTLNIISTAGINTDLAIGQNMSVTGITSVNASTAYVNALNIDGIAQKVWWTGGSAPADGGGSGMDLYTFNIMKIGSAQFYVIGTQTKTS